MDATQYHKPKNYPAKRLRGIHLSSDFVEFKGRINGRAGFPSQPFFFVEQKAGTEPGPTIPNAIFDVKQYS